MSRWQRNSPFSRKHLALNSWRNVILRHCSRFCGISIKPTSTSLKGVRSFRNARAANALPTPFRIPQRVTLVDGKVSIPKIELVEIVLHRRVEGILKSATIKQEPSGKWTITFVTEFEVPQGQTGVPETPIELDAGLETFVTTSEGEKTPPPNSIASRKRNCVKHNALFPANKKQAATNPKPANELRWFMPRTRSRRNDFLHKESRKLCDHHDCVCLEDLGCPLLRKPTERAFQKLA